MNTFTIKGMHCDACKKMITMEIEDAGLSDHVDSLEVMGGDLGRLTLKDGVSQDMVHAICDVINNMEGYSVE